MTTDESWEALESRQLKERQAFLLKQRHKPKNHSIPPISRSFIEKLRSVRRQRRSLEKQLEDEEQKFKALRNRLDSERSDYFDKEIYYQGKLSELYPEACGDCGLPLNHPNYDCIGEADGDSDNPFHEDWWDVEFTEEELALIKPEVDAAMMHMLYKKYEILKGKK